MDKRIAIFSMFIFFLFVTTACAINNDYASQENNNPSPNELAPVKVKELHILYDSVVAGVDAIKSVIPIYEQETGIKINLDSVPYYNLQQKAYAEVANQSSLYDVIGVDSSWMPNIASELTPLSKFMKDPNLSNPDQLQIYDFITKVFLDTSVFQPENTSKQPPIMDKVDIDKITDAGFEIYGLPIQSNVLNLAYREDLFTDPKEKEAFKAQYGRELEVPKTWEEFRKVAKFFTRPEQNLYGTTLMAGSGEWVFCDFKTFLYSFGGKLLDEQHHPIFNGPEGVAAVTFYNDLINKDKVTPPMTKTASWDGAAESFSTGLTAMSMNYTRQFLDPDVDGKAGYALIPGTEINGEIVHGPHLGTWQLSINKYSENKEEAYRFIEWITSAKVQKEMLKQQLHPTRRSVYEFGQTDAVIKKRFGNYYENLEASLKVGVGRPRITNYDEFSKIVQIQVNELVNGQGDPKKNLDKAAKSTRESLERSGYIQVWQNEM